MPAPDEIRQECLTAVREIVRDSVKTLHALPDPDARFRGLAKISLNFVRTAEEAYGYSSPSVRKWIPKPRHIDQMWKIMPCLAWLRRMEGELAILRIWGWALGVPLWRQGQRESCSDQTILNRIDRSITHIIREFTSTEIEIEYLDEPLEGVVYAVIFEKAPGPVTGIIEFKKIYVGGKGMWKQGRGYLRDGTHKIERMKKIS
jgi:hypothetical protein